MGHAPASGFVRPNGGSVAALLAATFALLVLGIVVVVAEVNPEANTFVFNVGKAWVPGAEGIGPYSGKETFLLVGWILSWGGLHFALRHRRVDVRVAFGAAMVMLLIAVLLIWPPVWHLFE